ncbi:hypothetical protein NW767_012786 [Fusarium falciforme]|nr:hypothetical protein NW767_012786 [Fusarium falciforme]
MDVNLWGTLLEMSFLLLMPPPPCVCLSVCLVLLSADQASSSCPERQGKESSFLFLEAKTFAPQEELTHTPWSATREFCLGDLQSVHLVGRQETAGEGKGEQPSMSRGAITPGSKM